MNTDLTRYSDLTNLLVAAGSDFYSRDSTGHNPLMAASCSDDNIENAKLLLEAGIDPNFHFVGECTALMYASFEGSIKTAKLLLEYGADPDLQTNIGYTALFSCSLEGQCEIAEMLLEASADKARLVNLQEINGNTVLMDASSFNHIKLVEVLLKAGADRSIRNVDNETASEIASSRGHEEIAKLLCE